MLVAPEDEAGRPQVLAPDDNAGRPHVLALEEEAGLRESILRRRTGQVSPKLDPKAVIRPA